MYTSLIGLVSKLSLKFIVCDIIELTAAYYLRILPNKSTHTFLPEQKFTPRYLISRVQTISAAQSIKFWIQQSYEGPILNKNYFELLKIISSSSSL